MTMAGPTSVHKTLDGFLDNQFALYQPASGTHRAGLDAVLLAATVPTDAAQKKLCDLGAGCGVAGMAALQRVALQNVLLVDDDAAIVGLVEQSLTLPVNVHLKDRVSLLQADVTLSGEARRTAGLSDNRVDYVITNPPYNLEALQPSPSSRRAHAHRADADFLNQWFKTACAILRPGGHLSTIVRPDSLPILLQSLNGRFGSVCLLPVHAREYKDATRLLVGAVRGGKGAIRFLPPLVLHGDDGAFLPEVDDILRGKRGIALS